MVILQIGPVGEFLAMQSSGGGCQWTPDPKTNSSGAHHTSDESLALDRAKVCPVWVERAGRPIVRRGAHGRLVS